MIPGMKDSVGFRWLEVALQEETPAELVGTQISPQSHP